MGIGGNRYTQRITISPTLMREARAPVSGPLGVMHEAKRAVTSRVFQEAGADIEPGRDYKIKLEIVQRDGSDFPFYPTIAAELEVSELPQGYWVTVPWQEHFAAFFLERPMNLLKSYRQLCRLLLSVIGWALNQVWEDIRERVSRTETRPEDTV